MKTEIVGETVVDASTAAHLHTPASPLTPEQIKSVKGQGFLYNKGTRNFSGRVITENGILTDWQMAAVTEAARRFGNGSIALTVRLTLEIQGISFEKIPEMVHFMKAHGMQCGGTGSKVRPIVACKGTTCSNGLCDTSTLGAIIHRRFYEGYRQVILPHKFKIAVGGCPNNCIKPDLNDVGIVAVRSPELILDKCRGCAKCGVVNACPMGAASVEDGKIRINTSLCNSCGKCAGKCYFSALEGLEIQYRVYVGGRWGKKVRQGSPLSRLVPETEALDLIEKTILLFKKEGVTGERFSDTIERLGMDYVEAALYSRELLDRKNDILEVQS
ncbi:dissimilatory sulfite reductase (desulfoviridin) alpha/beta subunit [Anaerotaenia torta]|uniref:(4Fe-4S)-binding protein n=1 Tax=Anaerotaenia torta TaxID=433293 RepID=UPI003D1AABC5